MSRYIDADLLYAETEKKIKANNEYRMAVVDGEFLELIDEAPTEDVVEVVRCKDCKYWQDNNGGYPHEECRWGKGETPDEDDFCSFGERRAEE